MVMRWRWEREVRGMVGKELGKEVGEGDCTRGVEI